MPLIESKARAQGTIEYLIIVAIVVVIALVVVSLLLDVSSNSGGVSEQSAKATWKASEPWGIIEWTMSTDGNLTVVLRNNTFETLGFNSITADGDTNSNSASIAPGATLTRVIRTNPSSNYAAGNKFSIAKSGISIDFNTSNIPNRKQYGVANIVGTAG